jgi:phospholipase C
MKKHLLLLLALGSVSLWAAGADAAGIDSIDTIVVIYAENRSFDNLYGLFPGANGLRDLKPIDYVQRDRDGSVLRELPPVWGGLTATGVVPAVTQAETAHLPNKPFAIDDINGFNLQASAPGRPYPRRRTAGVQCIVSSPRPP